MTLTLPSRKSIQFAIENGSREDRHLVQLYYAWYSRWFYRRRLSLISSLLAQEHLNRVLEVGVGSGIFIPELLTRAVHVSAIDLRTSYHGVQKMLELENVDLRRVELRQGNILGIPYPNDTFDAVVCISVLEHFADPKPPLLEMRRVVRPGGAVVIGFPGRNIITDRLFHMLGYNPREIHPSSHMTILASTREILAVEHLHFILSSRVPLYVACRAVRVI